MRSRLGFGIPWGVLARSLLFLGLIVFGSDSRGQSDTLVSFGSPSWKFLGIGWIDDSRFYSQSYLDDWWGSGIADFGYGEGDEQTIVDSGPPNDRYITTYFRRYFFVADPSQYSTITIRLVRDPGAVIYLNGEELYRVNIPEGPVGNDTFAATCLSSTDRSAIVTNIFPGSVLQPGNNLLAVEVHQCASTATTMSFDIEILGNRGSGEVSRGPYLQVGTSNSMTIRWRTSGLGSTRVRYGTNLANLNLSVANTTLTSEHEITLSNLAPATKYFYSVGTTNQNLAGDDSYFFFTAPMPGTVKPVRIWAIGDAGTGFAAQKAVYDRFRAFNGTRYVDTFLQLGDNAYCCGTDDQYQSYVFNTYPTLLRQTVTWPTVGNHETDQDPTLRDDIPYYAIFTMPRNGEAGGVPSGSEHYYSYDYANIHFICLDSMTAVFRQAGSAMLTWLEADLANNTRDWIIAFWHHPPYTHGSHNSDNEFDLTVIRQNFLPILENYGVDLVLTGHSHNYERSYFIDGHYGHSRTLSANHLMNPGDGRTNGTGAYIKPAGAFGNHRGAVYIVDGSSGGQGTGGNNDHPAMLYSTYDAGSVVIDVTGLRMDVTFINLNGGTPDYFTIDKNVLPLKVSRSNALDALLTWPLTDVPFRLEHKGTLNPVTQWSSNPAVMFTNGRRRSATVPITTGTNQFFQLRRLP